MTSSMPGSPAMRPRSRTRALLPTAVVLVVLLVLFQRFTDLATDWLWFRSLGYTGVLRTQLLTKAVLFVVFGVLLGLAVAANFVIAFRARPVYAVISPEQQSLERYRSSIAPYRRWIVLAGALLFGLLGASSAATQWQTFLLWRNSAPFGQSDPQFGKDLSFFMFSLPWWNFLLSFVRSMLVLSLLAAVVTHYLYGGLRLQGVGERTTPAARVHFSVLLGLFVLTQAVYYWLGRFNMSIETTTVGNNPFTGLRYTDVNAVLNARTLLAAIACICALLFFSNVFRRTWLLPGIGVGLLFASAILVGGVLPWVVQKFQVKPSELAKETPYIDRNIQATRDAYNIDVPDADATGYNPTEVPHDRLATEAAKVQGVRLLDPYLVPPTFRQQQQIQSYYRFPNILDIGRTDINGQRTDIVLGARELDPRRTGNWINDHLIFTHGYGLVAARSDRLAGNGTPEYIEQGIAQQGGAFGRYEPRIYFGEYSPEYSIVGGPGATPEDQGRELDYPEGNLAQDDVPRLRWGAGGIVLVAADVRRQIPGREHSPVRRHQGRVADPLHPESAGAGGEGRAVAATGQRPLSDRGRRARVVGDRRLNHQCPPPVLRIRQPRGRHRGQLRRAQRGAATAAREHQLHQ